MPAPLLQGESWPGVGTEVQVGRGGQQPRVEHPAPHPTVPAPCWTSPCVDKYLTSKQPRTGGQLSRIPVHLFHNLQATCPPSACPGSCSEREDVPSMIARQGLGLSWASQDRGFTRSRVLTPPAL